MIESPLRILMVDDSPEDREIYRRLLTLNNAYTYSWLEAELGAEGLELCRAESPDCILLDYRLPDLDGLEFLHALAAEQKQHIPVIMLTGQGNETIVVEAMRAGATDYLSKGVLSTSSLSRAIGNAVEKARLRTAVEEQHRLLEQTNEELRCRHEEIQRFYHHLSHELKTPLTAAREFASIMLDGLAGALSETQREYLDIVKECCDQMILLINDLLDVSRLDTGKLRLEPRPVALEAVISQAVAALTPTAQARGIRLQYSVVPELPLVRIDEKRIGQVLANLLNNALKFTPAGGEIVVRACHHQQPPETVLVSVIDTGRGIEAEQCAHIFERLYQVHRDDTSSKGGLGLGLYICRELVKLHGGEIWVTSTPGTGSTFSFTVPTHSASTTSAATAAGDVQA